MKLADLLTDRAVVIACAVMYLFCIVKGIL